MRFCAHTARMGSPAVSLPKGQKRNENGGSEAEKSAARVAARLVAPVLTLRITMLIHETRVLRLCDRREFACSRWLGTGAALATRGELSIRRSVDLSELTQW